jgi:hypothetical protein
MATSAPIGTVGQPLAAIGGPVPSAWREGTLTRATELEALFAWMSTKTAVPPELARATSVHLQATRDAATRPKLGFWRVRSGPPIERAISNLDAVEAYLLQIAPPDYLLGQMPCLVNQVRRHLAADDPRRTELERIANALTAPMPDRVAKRRNRATPETERLAKVESERRRIVSIMRGAGSAALREQLRVRSFRNVLVVSVGFMTMLALGLGLLGLLKPASLPLCFAPEAGNETAVVCPTAVGRLATDSPPTADIDDAIRATATRGDILLVELVGLAAAAVAAVTAIRKMRGSSEPHGLPVALAVLKLPTGALTALLGLLLMRGQFLPGLTALDTSGQIVAWALVFGYAQQLFTRLVDQQANVVLDRVRGADNPRKPATAGA